MYVKTMIQMRVFLPNDNLSVLKDVELFECQACGAMVGDTEIHDDWHYYVYSASNRANRALDRTDGQGWGR